MSAHLEPTMSYDEAMRKVDNGADCARREWMKVMSGGNRSFQDWYGQGPCVSRRYEGNICFRDKHGNWSRYAPTEEDKRATDWIEV